MTANFIHEFDISNIREGGADDEAKRLLKIWEDNGGYLHDDIVPLSPLLLLYDCQRSDQNSPEMLMVGTNALAGRILGSDWADTPKSAVKSLNADYIDLIAQNYRRAISEQRPVFDYVATDLQHKDGPPVKLRYQRLILPFQTIYGYQFLFCYSQNAGTSHQVRDLLRGGKDLLMKAPQDMVSANLCFVAPSAT